MTMRRRPCRPSPTPCCRQDHADGPLRRHAQPPGGGPPPTTTPTPTPTAITATATARTGGGAGVSHCPCQQQWQWREQQQRRACRLCATPPCAPSGRLLGLGRRAGCRRRPAASFPRVHAGGAHAAAPAAAGPAARRRPQPAGPAGLPVGGCRVVGWLGVAVVGWCSGWVAGVAAPRRAACVWFLPRSVQPVRPCGTLLPLHVRGMGAACMRAGTAGSCNLTP